MTWGQGALPRPLETGQGGCLAPDLQGFCAGVTGILWRFHEISMANRGGLGWFKQLKLKRSAASMTFNGMFVLSDFVGVAVVYIYILFVCVCACAHLILLCIYIQLILAQFPRKGLPHNKSQEALKICHTWSNHGWLVVDLPLWKMMEFVSWDGYSIPNMMGKSIQIPWFQTTNQLYSPIINHYQPLLTIINHQPDGPTVNRDCDETWPWGVYHQWHASVLTARTLHCHVRLPKATLWESDIAMENHHVTWFLLGKSSMNGPC